MSWIGFMTAGDQPDPEDEVEVDGEGPPGVVRDIQLVGKGRSLRVVEFDDDVSIDDLAQQLAPDAERMRCILDRHHLD